MPRSRPESVVPALSFGVAALGCSLAIVGFLFGTDPEPVFRVLVPVSVVAASAVGGVGWWLLVSRPDSDSRRRGALAGVLVALCTHPVTWYLTLFVYGVGSAGSTLDGGALTLASGLQFGLFYTGVSLFVTGFPTAVVGAGVGVVLVRLRADRDVPASAN